jgi:hypothetical protein
MATDNSMKKEYDEQAGGYEGFYSAPTPLPRLETELFLTALGKPTGAKVLDRKSSSETFLFITILSKSN